MDEGNLPNNYTRAMVSTMMDKENFKAWHLCAGLPRTFTCVSVCNTGMALC